MGSSAVYTAGLAMFVDSWQLTVILLLYSSMQLVSLMLTSMDVAKPGDAYNKALQNIDTPRTLYALQCCLGNSGVAAGEYLAHLYRVPSGIRILRTLITTPVMIRFLITMALPTVAVARQQSTKVGSLATTVVGLPSRT